MSFQERSAWVMLLVLLVTGYLLAQTVITQSIAVGELVEPSLGLVINYVILVIVLSVISQIVIATTSPKAAAKGEDEREQQFTGTAGRISGSVLAIAVTAGLVNYLFRNDGALLFYIGLAGLILAEVVQNLVIIFRHRRGY